MNTADAGAVYALFTSLVYFLGLPGGWIADRYLGQRKAVLTGGVLIALGYFAMAVPSMGAFYAGLGLVIAERGCSSRTSARSSASSTPRRTSGATPGSRSSTWASTSAPSSAP